MMKVSFCTLGCKVNAYETEAMQQRLEDAGYKTVPFESGADICIINTCTVTNIADRKSRQMLHRARKRNPNAVIVAVGCYTESGFESCKSDSAVDIIVGNNRKSDIVKIIEDYMADRENAENEFMADINGALEYEDMPISRVENHTRAYIKIQDGCNQFCTYCIIPYTRGRIRSRSLTSIVSEAEVLADKGYKEIVLTGIHVSSYGKDFKDSEDNLLTVIERLSGIEGIERIRLSSLEQGIITEEFLAGLSGINKFCPHFHLSLQSGSGTVLKRMNRRYTPGEYYEKCRLIRKFYPDAAITTDVIVGFPGETKEEAAETVEFVKKIRFAEMHIFKYSARNGTKAAKMPNQISERLKNERSAELIALSREMYRTFSNHFLGYTKKVLLEEKVVFEGRDYWTGYTPEYVKVLAAAENDSDMSKVLADVKLEREPGSTASVLSAYAVYGKINKY